MKMQTRAALLMALTFSAYAPNLTSPAHASIVGITNVASLGGGADAINWDQLSTFTQLSSPQAVVSNGGLNAIVTSAGNTFYTLPESPAGWEGNFASGTTVLWNGGVGPDITISFANLVSGAGAQIQSDAPFAAFTAQVTAYGSGGDVLGSYTENGISNRNNDGSAIFIGLLDNNADITKIKFDLTSAAFAPNDFAIGTLDVSGGSVSATPLPAALLLFASALVGLGLLGRRRAKKTSV